MKTFLPSILEIQAATGELRGRVARIARARLAPALLLALALLAGPGAAPEVMASALPPDTMTYQGFLVDGNGNALAPTTPQNYPVVFRIFAVSSGAGASLWTEQQIVTVDKGNFSVLLGEGTPVGGEPRPALSSVFAGSSASDRYISVSVTVGGNTSEILPRLRLVPSPYAFLASSATSLVQPNGSPFINFDGGQVNVTGNLGVGTPAAGRKLQIGDVNVANSEGMIRLASRSGAGGASRVWDVGVPETDQVTTGIGYSFVIDDTARAGTEFMVQFGTGNVGIGTASPERRLHVSGPEPVLGRFDSSSPIGTWLTLGNTSPGGLYWQMIATGSGNGEGPGKLLIGSGVSDGSTTPRLTLQNNGNVGVGSSSPNALLSLGGSLANTKLALWDGGPSALYGLGVQPGQFRLHLNQASDNFTFLNGPAGAELMKIFGNGRVGIGLGTATPSDLLQLGSVGSAGDIFLRMESIGGNQFANGIKLRNFSDDHGFDLINQERNGAGLQANGFHIVRHNSSAVGASALFIDKFSGNVGLGSTAPSAPLTIQSTDPRLRVQLANGNYADFGRNGGGVGSGGALYLQLNNHNFGGGNRAAVYDGDSNWDFSSDRRLKKDIVDAESMLDRALRVQVRRFRWKDEPGTAKHQLGVIAQEVQPLFPDLVGEFEDTDSKEKTLTVGYGDFALIGIKALQEYKAKADAEHAALQREISELRQEIDGLRGKLARAGRVDALESQLEDLKQVVQRLAAGRNGNQAAAPGGDR